jgi:ankyrin repeat protein
MHQLVLTCFVLILIYKVQNFKWANYPHKFNLKNKFALDSQVTAHEANENNNQTQIPFTKKNISRPLFYSPFYQGIDLDDITKKKENNVSIFDRTEELNIENDPLLLKIIGHLVTQKEIRRLKQFGSRVAEQKLIAPLPDLFQTIDSDYLKEKESISKADLCGARSLLSAVRSGSIQSVLHILKNDDFTEYYDKDGYSAAHLALKEGHDSLLNILIENGAILGTTNHLGETLVHTAIKNHDLTMLSYLLNKNKKLLHQPNFNKETPMITAAKLGYTKIVINLFETYKASLTDQDIEGKTAFIIAAEAGFIEIVIFLSTKMNQQTIEMKSIHGLNALHYLCNQNNFLKETTVSTERDYMIAGSAIVEESFQTKGRAHHIETLHFILKNYPSLLESMSHQNDTSLLLASKNNNTILAKELLTYNGMDVCQKDSLGRDALTWAHLNKNSRLYSMLSSYDKEQRSLKNKIMHSLNKRP